MSEPPVPPTPPPPGPPPMAPPPPAAPPGGNRNLMIALSYLWLLAIVPLVAEKEDKEVQWHAKHGLVLMVAEIILWIALTIFSTLVAAVTAGFGGCLYAIFLPLLSLAILVFHILCIVKGINGERLLVPGISQFADRF